jgi:predicted helicase
MIQSKKRGLSGLVMLFEPSADYETRKANLSLVIVEQLKKYYTNQPSPEQILYYIYAVLYSKIYRTKYSEFLKTDFPRLPFTKRYKIFVEMAEYGGNLVDLHLLKSVELDPPIARFHGKGTNKIDKIVYEGGRIYINKDQFFDGIASNIWEYQIGGYQVCDKWLKDRKGRALSLDEVKHYCQMATSLQKTMEIQKEIDDLYPEVEKGSVDLGNSYE